MTKKDEDNHSLGNNLSGDYLGRKSPSTEYILLGFHHDHSTPCLLDAIVTYHSEQARESPLLERIHVQKMKDEKSDRFYSLKEQRQD